MDFPVLRINNGKDNAIRTTAPFNDGVVASEIRPFSYPIPQHRSELTLGWSREFWLCWFSCVQPIRWITSEWISVGLGRLRLTGDGHDCNQQEQKCTRNPISHNPK